MKIDVLSNSVQITKEPTDPKYYGLSGESKLLYVIKNQLNKEGYDLIKKRMYKDGHLVDDPQQYLRTRKKGAGKADIYIYDGKYAVRLMSEDFNKGRLTLSLENDVFNP